MLTELTYKDRFYIFGTMEQVMERLSKHCRHYTTVKEMLDARAPK